MALDRNQIAEKIYRSKQAGYSNDEIFEYLKSIPDLKDKVVQSSENGYSPSEVVDFLGSESPGRNITRTATSFGIGAANLTPAGIVSNLLQAFGTGEALGALEDELSPERLRDLQEKFPGFGVPSEIDREKYLKAVQGASESFPTPSNIGRMIEESTGIPFEPRTNVQKAARFIGEASKLGTGSIPSRIAKGIAAQGVESGLERLGVPEELAELAALPVALRKGGIKREKLPPEFFKEYERSFKKPISEKTLSSAKAGSLESRKLPLSTSEKIEDSLSKVKSHFSAPKNYAEKISKTAFKDSESAIGEIRSAIKNIRSETDKNFSKKFENLKAITEKLEVVPQNIYKETNQILESINPNILASLNPKEQKFLRVLEELKGKFAVERGGDVLGFKPVSVWDLIEYKRSIGSGKNLEGKFKHLYGLIEKEISDTLEKRSSSLLNKYKTLNKDYSEYRDILDKKSLENLLNPKDTSYVSIRNGLLKPDSVKDLENILVKSPEGRRALAKHKREFFSEALPKANTPIEIQDLKRILGRENEKTVESALAKRKGIPEILDKSEKELLSMMKDKSSIRKIKKELSSLKDGDSLFNALKEAKVEEILSNNKISASSSIKDAFDVLNNRKNFEIIAELEGFTETFEKFQALEKQALETARKDTLNKKLSSITKKALREIARNTTLYKILKIFIPYAH